MAATTEPRSGIKYGWGLGFNGWHTEMDDNLKLLGRFGFHLSVKDKDLSAPPGSPAAGDAYIVAASATGAWAGKDGQIAVYDGAAWAFGVPRAGWLANVEDEDVLYKRGASAWAAASAGSSTPTTQPYDMVAYYPGVPTASAKVSRVAFTRAVTFAAAFAGSVASADVAATASTVFDVQKAVSGSTTFSSIGSVTFAAGATVGSFALAGGASFATGDRLRILAPATADATLADISITLVGTR